MKGQRKFKCTACSHEFEVAHGTGQRGHDIKCPSCGEQVYRLDSGCGGNGRGNGRGRGRGRGFGGEGRGDRERGQCPAVKDLNDGAELPKADDGESLDKKEEIKV